MTAGLRDYRPALHISAPVGWMNDPNGLSFVDGVWHVFYQSNPQGHWFGTMQWGHVSSTDLLRWDQHPPALVPSQEADEDGCWSGCVVLDNGVPRAFYTGVRSLGRDQWTQAVCTATSDADLLRWRKAADNPLATPLPTNLVVLGLRDPFVWKTDGGWAMILGTGIATRGGAILLFTSSDLQAWTYEGVVFGDPVEDSESLWTGRFWECPAMIPVGDGSEHLLMFSVWDDAVEPTLHYTVYAIGVFDGVRFAATCLDRVDHGVSFYAGTVFLHDDGRALIWGWLREALSTQGREAQDFAGCLTFPREVSWSKGIVEFRPARELEALRHDEWRSERQVLAPGCPTIRTTDPRQPLEIEVEFSIVDADEVGVGLRATADRTEETVIRYFPAEAALRVDRQRSSSYPEAIVGISTVRLLLKPDELLRLRILLDNSVLEVFANERVVITERIYPVRPDGIYNYAYVIGGTANLEKMITWTLGT